MKKYTFHWLKVLQKICKLTSEPNWFLMCKVFPVETEVGSIRKINWNRIQTNFFIVFPTGVLESAPQFNVLITRVPSPEQSAAYQQSVVKAFPNVSIIDLTLILKAVDDILSKVSFVIRFMALFSILTGFAGID